MREHSAAIAHADVRAEARLPLDLSREGTERMLSTITPTENWLPRFFYLSPTLPFMLLIFHPGVDFIYSVHKRCIVSLDSHLDEPNFILND